MKGAFDHGEPVTAVRELLECDIEDLSVAKARRRGWWVRKFKTPAHRSAPDDIFAQNGRVFWVEFKAPGKKPTPKQLDYHEEMRAAGLTVYVCDTRESFNEVLERETRRAAAGYLDAITP